MTRNAWPIRGRFPSAVKKESASKPSRAPESAEQRSSTIRASIVPFTPPVGSIIPSRPCFGSVVGWPSRSTAQSGGIGFPSRAATRSLPRATTESDRSITTGGSPWRGKMAAIGLVPKIGRRPSQAGIAAGELLKASATRFAAAAGRRWYETAPQWWLFVTEAQATPNSRARSTAWATARVQAGYARPSAASTSKAPPRARTTRGSARPSSRPLRRWPAYWGTRETPCESSPCSSIATNACAVAAAACGFAPARSRARWAIADKFARR